MEIAKKQAEADYNLLVAETAPENPRTILMRVLGKLEALVRSPLVRIRHRVSLVSGSLFVLSTLFLPTVMDSCGRPRPGYELARGNQDMSWPSVILTGHARASQAFYLFCLALAAAAFFCALFQSRLRHRQTLLGWFVAIAGSVAVFLTADFFTLLALERFDQFQSWSHLNDVQAGIPFLGLAVLFPVACLKADFWTAKGAAAWAVVAAGFISLMFLAQHFFENSPSDLEESLAIIVCAIYAVFPLALWLRYWVFGGKAEGLARQEMRKRLAVFIAIAALFDFVNFAVGVEGFWGLLPFLVGTYLIFLGYAQLRRRAAAAAGRDSTRSAGLLAGILSLAVVLSTHFPWLSLALV